MSFKVVIPCRFSYVAVFEPKSIEEGMEPKYSVCCLIDKNDTVNVNKIKKAIQDAMEEGKSSKWGGKIPANAKNPLRDGDAERGDMDEFKGMYFINAYANIKHKPGVVDKMVQPIIDQDEFYSGCYGNASISLYPFASKTSNGVACGLNNVQKVKDGERLSGGSTPQQDFAPVADGAYLD